MAQVSILPQLLQKVDIDLRTAVGGVKNLLSMMDHIEVSAKTKPTMKFIKKRLTWCI